MMLFSRHISLVMARSGANGGLGAGAIAGIAIGAVLFVVIFVAVVWFVVRRRAAKRSAHAARMEVKEEYSYNPSSQYSYMPYKESGIVNVSAPGWQRPPQPELRSKLQQFAVASHREQFVGSEADVGRN